jgi:hypothetical protein
MTPEKTRRIAGIGALLILLAGMLWSATWARAEIVTPPTCATTDNMAVIQDAGTYKCGMRSGHFECALVQVHTCAPNITDTCARYMRPAQQEACKRWNR